ncbi:MAG: hypothetical protein K2X27_13240 [Candidatus Obscuribacterales bacterium]|nr:hypothetical protein [Candidatus Obscuribacterales bacterium]
MENESQKLLDPKTARIIEELDHSLHNMEQSLGMDHPVVAKVLDSYAKVLRQNKVRPLDALNMEARARAIRAKLNQEEAEKQSLGLETSEQAKPLISTSQLKVLAWIACSMILIGFALLFSDVLKTSIKNTSLAVQKTDSDENPLDASEEGKREGLEPGSGRKKLTVFQLAKEIMGVKALAKVQLRIGLDAEKKKDYQTAERSYTKAIDAALSLKEITGKSVYSEELAACFEGGKRMAEVNYETDLATMYGIEAEEIRKHLK